MDVQTHLPDSAFSWTGYSCNYISRSSGRSNTKPSYSWEFLIALPFDWKLMRSDRALRLAPMVGISDYDAHHSLHVPDVYHSPGLHTLPHHDPRGSTVRTYWLQFTRQIQLPGMIDNLSYIVSVILALPLKNAPGMVHCNWGSMESTLSTSKLCADRAGSLRPFRIQLSVLHPC